MPNNFNMDKRIRDFLRDYVDNLKTPENPSGYDDLKQLISEVLEYVKPERNTHTPNAALHFGTMDFKYPCCERVAAHNRAIDEMEAKQREIGL